MRWTRAQYACLGLWSEPNGAAPRTLKIAGEYVAETVAECIEGTSYEPSRFPPESILALSGGVGGRNVLTMVPLIGSRKNRGVLVVVAPIETELLDHASNAGDWAAQVGAALERADIDQQLRKNAFHDALTGLPNRALLMDRLERLSAEGSEQFAVLFLDLDDFKKINDSMGHPAGDQLLVQIARRLERTVGGAGLVARLGGDEFAIVVPDAARESEVLERVSAIQAALREPFPLDGDSVFTSCSIGVAFRGKERFSAAELLRDADTAMYRAKLQGRARYEVFHLGMHTQAVERLRLDSRLRQALANEEFMLVYQPIVLLTTGHAIGAEALIRWNHPEQGCLSPGRFLAVAEEVGLGIPISEWVLETACRQALSWQREGGPPLYVNVNVPAEHLQAEGFVEFVERVLQKTGLAPHALGIELVESSLVDRRDTTARVLGSLIDIGVRIAIDDFGTGYSSLSYLKNFPVSVLKIDRSFVQGLPADSRDVALSNAIITMGHGLGLTVVAEGVETEEQLEALRQQGCDAVQGYLLCRPVELEACKRFLHRDQRPLVRRSSSDKLRAVLDTPPGSQRATAEGKRGALLQS